MPEALGLLIFCAAVVATDAVWRRSGMAARFAAWLDRISHYHQEPHQ